MNEERKRGVHIYNEILFSHKKEGNLAICDNVDGPRGHYAKWNKSDTERQILYDLTYSWTLEAKMKTQKFKLIDTENRLGVARGGVWGGWDQWSSKGTNFKL